MKRLHLRVGVPDLAEAARFYGTLFGAPPTVLKDDYAKMDARRLVRGRAAVRPLR